MLRCQHRGLVKNSLLNIVLTYQLRYYIIMQRIVLPYEPSQKQKTLHNTLARQILYGGSAGGGKSFGLRWDLIQWCLSVPGISTYLFRRSFSELENNHVRFLRREIPEPIAKWNVSKAQFQFFNGSVIQACHCENSEDFYKFQGIEAHVLAIDEASLFLPNQLIELRSRVRLGSFASQVPPEYKKYLPRCIFTSNPGGPSHNWLKDVFINQSPSDTIFYDANLINPDMPEDKGWPSVYIKAGMSDNKFLDENYASVFSAMSPERAKALRDGDWDVVAGAAFHSLSERRHKVKAFDIPLHWTKFQSMDWGTASPFAVLWLAVAGEETLVLNNKHLDATDANPNRAVRIPAGALLVFDELYGYTGVPNQGLRLDSVAVAKMIVEKEASDKPNLSPISYRVADAAMFAQFDGISPAERMMTSNGKLVLGKSKKDRTVQYNEILCRLAGNAFLKEDGLQNDPMLFISDKCRQGWRTLPPLMLDDLYPDKGWGEGQEDHWADALAYGLTSRPLMMTKERHIREEYLEARRQIRDSMTADAYSTS